MKLYYLLLFFSTIALFKSQTTLQAELSFQDSDCNDLETGLYYQIKNELGKTIDSAYVMVNCTFNEKIELTSGSYTIYFYSDTYQDIQRNFQVDNAAIIDLGDLNFITNSELDEVVIKSNKNDFIVQEADKTIYNIEHNDILNSGTLYETVSKMPGMIVTPEGMIIYNGKMIAIWIDGQPSQLSGQDLIALLNSIPANIIEKIELIPNPGAAYDANTSGGILNIITKNKSIKGISGSFTNDYGYSKADKIDNNMSVNINSRQNKWVYQLTMGNSFDSSEENTNSNREIESDNTLYKYQSQNTTDYYAPGNFVRTNLSYNLTDNSTLSGKFNYSQNEEHNHYGQDNIFSNTLNLVTGRYDDKSNRKEVRLQYNSKLDTLGKLINLSGNYSYYKSEGFRPQTSTFDLPLYSISNQNQHNRNYTLKGDATLPFAKADFTLELGTKYDLQKVTDYGEYNFNSTDEEIFEHPVYDDIRDFDYQNSNLAFYTQLKKKWGNFNATAGVRWENFNLIGKNDGEEFYNENFSNFYPSVFLNYDLSAVQLFLNYTKKVDMPSYSQINPNLDGYFDSFYSDSGNPNLKPRFYHNAEFKISFMEYVSFNLNYSKTENQVFDAFEIDGPSVRRIPTVFDKTERLNLGFQLPIPFAFFTEGMDLLKRPDLGPETLSYTVMFANYNQTYFSSDQDFFNSNRPHNWWLGSYTNIILPKGFNFNMFQMWIPKGVYNQYEIAKPIWRFDVSIYRYFFDKKLKMSVGVRDLFDSYENDIYYSQPNLQTDFRNKWDSQKFKFSLTWQIGKYKGDENQGFNNSGANSSEGGIGF